MWTLLFVVFATGSPAVLQAAPVQGNSGRCSFAGVFHIEGISRYSLTFQKAGELCQSLGYRLATQEQVTEAYKKGLRTCRYGWIDGQNVTFLPHINGPNCDSSSAEITFHAKAGEFLSDVYCFDPSDSSPNCDDVKSEDVMNGNAARDSSFYAKPHEDFITEFKTEGFLVDVEEILERVKRETSLLSDIKPSAVPSMRNNEDIKDPTSKPHIGKTPSVLLFDTEGSGSGFINPEPSHYTTSLVTTGTAKSDFIEKYIKKEVAEVPARAVNNSQVKEPRRVNVFTTPESEAKEMVSNGLSSTLMIITAFCVFIGVIVCIFVAIGTRDKWYGPSKSADITTEKNNKDYSKTETLPLSEKEQEIVALMNVTNMKNGQTVDITTADEHEKEYLM